jgi:predicted CXXCH cytochrome family protein
MLTPRGSWTVAGVSLVALGILGTAVLRQRRTLEAAAVAFRTVPRCEQCHAAIAKTYAHVGMARSFHRLSEPEPDLPAAAIQHARSGRRYEVLRRDGRLIQRRYELSPSGTQVNSFEMDATHVVGSGNHARTYFHLTAAGEMIQLPLTWYTQENRWYLSPGFDQNAPPDFTRRADDSCLFCHNGYPRGEAMASGIDCERCHGDGARHTELASHGATAGQLRAAIVNPARLSPELQLDVCMQCHLETTSVELPQMIRRFDRSVFSYRPGEPLGSYIVHFDAPSGSDRFEIVNQAYRLRQSACFRASDGRLTCVTCHNPHNVPRGTAAVAWYRAKCTGCHSSVKTPAHPGLAEADCAGCHMPRRRTEDAVHVIMTDHWIVRRPARTETQQPSEKPRSFRGALSVYFPEMPGVDRDLYLGAALIVGGRDRSRGIALLERSAGAQSSGKALAVLAEGRLAAGDAGGAVRDFRHALELGPRTARLHYNLAQALDAAGQPVEAGHAFDDALGLDPQFPEAHYAYANHLVKVQDLDAAVRHYQAAIQARPVYAEAQNNLGNVLAEKKDLPAARSHFEEALRIDPASAEAHDNQARVLAAQGQAAEALAHARRAVELNPSSPAAHFNLGQLLQLNENSANAINEYRTALRLRPDFAAAHLALGAVLGDSGQLQAAAAEFRAVLRIDPQNALARKYLDMATGGH